MQKEFPESDISTAEYYQMTPTNTLYFEDFASNKNTTVWTGSNADRTCNVVDGCLNITAHRNISSSWANFKFPADKDYQVEIRMKSNLEDLDRLTGVLVNATSYTYVFSLINKDGFRVINDLGIDYLTTLPVQLYRKPTTAIKQEFHTYTIRKVGGNTLFFFNKQYKHRRDNIRLQDYGFRLDNGETITIDYIKIEEF